VLSDLGYRAGYNYCPDADQKKKAKSKPWAKAKQIWKRKIVPPPKKASTAPQGGPNERT